jgi:hypothetical protein
MSNTYEYVALQPINVGGTLAYNPGDFVPAANVEANGYEVGVQVELRDPAEVTPTAVVSAVVDPELVANDPTLADSSAPNKDES